VAIVNISVPDQLKSYVDERVNSGDYGSTSEYFRELIREDRKRQDAMKLEALILHSLDSPSVPWTKDHAEVIMNAVRERRAAKGQ